MEWLLGTYPSWSLFVTRIVLGIIFFAHGTQKVFGWFGGDGLKPTAAAWERHMKIPPALTLLAAFTELFGSLAVLIGLLARPAAFGLIIVMVVAIARVHARHGFFLARQPGAPNGYEFNLALIGLALALLIGGGGALSLDRMLVSFAR